MFEVEINMHLYKNIFYYIYVIIIIWCYMRYLQLKFATKLQNTIVSSNKLTLNKLQLSNINISLIKLPWVVLTFVLPELVSESPEAHPRPDESQILTQTDTIIRSYVPPPLYSICLIKTFIVKLPMWARSEMTSLLSHPFRPYDGRKHELFPSTESSHE